MNILALDIATKTGFCTEHESGVWDLNIKSNESKGIRLLKLRSNIDHYVQKYNINLISFERSAGMFKASLILAGQMQGVMLLYCEEHGIEYISYAPTEIKKFATGAGNAKKDQMIASCKEKYGTKVIDDNHADAIHLYHYTKHKLAI